MQRVRYKKCFNNNSVEHTHTVSKKPFCVFRVQRCHKLFAGLSEDGVGISARSAVWDYLTTVRGICSKMHVYFWSKF